MLRVKSDDSREVEKKRDAIFSRRVLLHSQSRPFSLIASRRSRTTLGTTGTTGDDSSYLCFQGSGVVRSVNRSRDTRCTQLGGEQASLLRLHINPATPRGIICDRGRGRVVTPQPGAPVIDLIFESLPKRVSLSLSLFSFLFPCRRINDTR